MLWSLLGTGYQIQPWPGLGRQQLSPSLNSLAFSRAHWPPGQEAKLPKSIALGWGRGLQRPVETAPSCSHALWPLQAGEGRKSLLTLPCWEDLLPSHSLHRCGDELFDWTRALEGSWWQRCESSVPQGVGTHRWFMALCGLEHFVPRPLGW